MAGYITVDTLKNNLGVDLFGTLSNQAINAGANFLAGKTTSAFQKAATSGLGTETIKATGNIAASGALVLHAANPEVITNIVTGLTATTVSTLTTKSGEILGKNIAKITQKTMSLPASISSYTMSYFNEHKLSISDLLSVLSDTSESRKEKKSKELEKKQQSEFTNKVNNTISKIQKGMEKFNDGIEPIIEMVSSYMEQGPEWVADKLDKFVTDKLSYADEFISKNTNIACEEIDKFAYNQGNALGKQMVSTYNSLLKNQAQKQLTDIKKLKTKATIKAKAAMQAGILKVMAMTGINIPI